MLQEVLSICGMNDRLIYEIVSVVVVRLLFT